MPDYRRANTKGGTYFFTVNTLRRQPILARDDVRAALREGINLARAVHPFRIDAWVLLPDHLHCIWTLPEGDANFGLRWALIKRHVSKQCAAALGHEAWRSASRVKRKESALWQRRFWEHQIRDEADFMRHADYIHWNPVKHGYVGKVVEWPFSTFHRFMENRIYRTDWGGGEVSEADGRGYGE